MMQVVDNPLPMDEVQQRLVDVLAPYPRSEQIRCIENNLKMEDLNTWINGNSFVLEKNDCSRIHKLQGAIRDKAIIKSNFDALPLADDFFIIQQNFVVKHDWAKAFEGAEGILDEFKLPYEECAFEFRISGRNVISIASEMDEHLIHFFTLVEVGDFWCGFNVIDKEESNLIRFVFNQIRAICIALDADVATHTVVRAPVKLNEKRAKSGKTPLSDYRVVDLARRHRVANPAHGTGTGTRKRLHFRRGHWRHYETTKTWVKWCMVGDPDLGFISKHYAL